MKKEIVEAPTETKTLRKPAAPVSSSKVDNEKKVSEKKRNSDAGGGKISSGTTDSSATKSPSTKSPTVVIPLTKVNVPKAFSDERAATNANKAGSSKSQEMKKEISSPDSASTPTTRPRRSITLKNKTDENNTTK